MLDILCFPKHKKIFRVAAYIQEQNLMKNESYQISSLMKI